jgi:hypothetical protein
MALTYSSVNIEQPPQQGGGANNPPFSATFSIGSWISDSGEYVLSIAEATHQRGNDLIVQVYEINGSIFQLVDVAAEVTPTGDVNIKINQIPENRFEGRITIAGE